MTSSIRLMVSDIVRAGREAAEQTRAKKERCPVCDGYGRIWEPDMDDTIECSECNGAGWLVPDPDAEERAAFGADTPPDIEPLGDDEPREDYVRDLQDRFTEDE